MQTKVIKVLGMSCGSCISAVNQAISEINGVNEVSVSLSNGMVTVQYDEQLTSVDRFDEAVEKAGYAVNAPIAHDSPQGKACCCG